MLEDITNKYVFKPRATTRKCASVSEMSWKGVVVVVSVSEMSIGASVEG